MPDLRHPVARYTLLASPLCILFFLWLAGFFAAWEGRAVGQRPSGEGSSALVPMVIVTEAGDTTEVGVPRGAVASYALPTFTGAVVSNAALQAAPETEKRRFTFLFRMKVADGAEAWHATTTPNALGLAVVMFFAGFFLHNISISGVPWRWEPTARASTGAEPGDDAPDDGEAARAPGDAPPPPVPAARSRYGPPPKKRSRRR